MEQKKDHDTERMILDAAERLFLEKGFAMTSTIEIAKEANCNQALVHYYFRSKENLFQSIFEKKIKILVSNFEENSQKELTFEERVTQTIESHFEMVRANPRLPFLIFNELITNPSRLNSLKEKIIELPKAVLILLQNELRKEVEAGRVHPMEITDLILSIISLNVMLFLTSPIWKTITGMSDEDFEALVEHRKKEHVRIILASLKP
jgi:AcrR family transcriptional regulator